MEDGRSGSGHWELEQDENVPVLLRAKEIAKLISPIASLRHSLGLRAFGVCVGLRLSGAILTGKVQKHLVTLQPSIWSCSDGCCAGHDSEQDLDDDSEFYDGCHYDDDDGNGHHHLQD